MTDQDKELLLKDLCARLPYGVKVNLRLPNHTEKTFEDQIGDLEDINKYGGYLVISKGVDYRGLNLDIKPYLRPMSSMTEEEKIAYQALFNYDGVEYPEEYIDWHNSHHLDYRGLIPKSLVLEAPEGIYNI